MLNYLLTHSEFSFSPQETSDLCEAFDGAIANLHEHDARGVNWNADEVRAALAGEIVAERQRGVTDVKALCEHAVNAASTLFQPPADNQS